jgi:two-component system capsular synthesis response regulator RcsB
MFERRRGNQGVAMRIIISDDHPLVLMGLKALLQCQGEGLTVVGEARSTAELFSVLAAQPCDLLITDFSMPDVHGADDGLGLLASLRARFPMTPILVVTMVTNPALVRGMLALGVSGVLDKSSMVTELILAIRTLRAGRTYLGEATRRRLKQFSTSAGSDALASVTEGDPLSVREAEVLRLLAQGQTVTEIAHMSGRSVKTISQQKRYAMRKLGLQSDSQLYQYARSHQLA